MAIETQTLLRYFIIDQQLRRFPESTTENLRACVENEINLTTNAENMYSVSSLKSDIKSMKKLLKAPISFSFTKNRYEYVGNSQLLNLPVLASEYFCNFLRLQLISVKKKHSRTIVHYEHKSIAGNDHLLNFIKAIVTKNKFLFSIDHSIQSGIGQ
jgi:hypothetical protein